MRLMNFAAALAVALAGTATVADVEKAVKNRNALMDLYAFYLGQLGAMAKGETPYDAEKASAAAASLAALSTVDQSAMWPMGSSTDELGDKTRALPVIWTTFPAIAEKGAAFGAAAAAMNEAAGKDLDSLRGAMGALGGSCGACHKDFRQPK